MTGLGDLEIGSKMSGHFTVDDGRSVLGELSLQGAETSLYLHDPEFFHIRDDQHPTIEGVLHDRTRVTLVKCRVSTGTGSATVYQDHYHFAEIAPAFVISGNRHLASDEPTISSVSFHVDDAEIAFHDHQAIAQVIDPLPLIKTVVAGNEQRIKREIATGPSPAVIYFTGRTELSEVETAIGTVRIRQLPIVSSPFASASYAAVKSRTLVQIDFAEPQMLDTVLHRILAMMRFVEILVGRPQNIDLIALDTNDEEPAPPLRLFWIHPPQRPTGWEQQRTDSSEVLISVVRDREEFDTVLTRWLANDDERLDARMRFSTGLNQQRNFPIDRLVGAANMFDILPAPAYPPVAALAPHLAKAKLEARTLFRGLPPSPERDSVLNALGRLGHLTLRTKVRHRAGVVSQALKRPLTHLDMVTDEAVKCRNHYVHGSPGSFDYAKHGHVTVFLTRVLEFLFAASDLVEAGWDIARWQALGSILSHPFNRVLYEWDHYANLILRLREEDRQSSSDD